MSQRKIRRLPVVEEGKLVGMVTENDIIRIWPTLIEVTREFDRAGLESQFAKGIEGHCEACGVYSTNLMWDRNLLACPECRGGLTRTTSEGRKKTAREPYNPFSGSCGPVARSLKVL